jgi:hypothetical protein
MAAEIPSSLLNFDAIDLESTVPVLAKASALLAHADAGGSLQHRAAAPLVPLDANENRTVISPRLILALALLYTSVAISADVPTLRGRVDDYAGLLQPQVREQLESRLARYEQETTHQIAILTVPSLHGESIEAFSRRVANTWALGRKGLDNGVLVTVAPTERSVRIELGI